MSDADCTVCIPDASKDVKQWLTKLRNDDLGILWVQGFVQGARKGKVRACQAEPRFGARQARSVRSRGRSYCDADKTPSSIRVLHLISLYISHLSLQPSTHITTPSLHHHTRLLRAQLSPRSTRPTSHRLFACAPSARSSCAQTTFCSIP